MRALIPGLPDAARSRTLAAGACALVATWVSGCAEPVTAAISHDAPGDERLRLDSAGLPIIRAGLWEVVDQAEGDTPRTVRKCMTRALGGSADEVLAIEAQAGCAKTRQVDSGSLHVVATCRFDGHGAVYDYAYKGSPTAYDMAATVTISADGVAPVATRGVARGRWLSECPGDMVPGDIQEFED